MKSRFLRDKLLNLKVVTIDRKSRKCK